MSQHSPYPPSNRGLSFVSNGHPQHASGTPSSSALDGQPRPTDVDPLNLHSFGTASSVTSGFLGDLDLANPSSMRNVMGPPDDRAGFAGLGYNRLVQFYVDRDEPWNQEMSRARGHQEALPSSFTGFRDTVVPSECETSIGPGTDSGYGSQARQSVGIPSVYGDVDRSSEAIMNHMADLQIPGGSIHGTFQVHDVNHLRQPWSQGILGRPDAVPTNNLPSIACQYCHLTFRSRSDHKKHIARHEKPHRCPEKGCSKATKGFGTSNDLERHLKSVHRKGGTRFRCHHGACLHKAKDWPRADNFRSHLKKIHTICLDAEDSLDEYIYHSVNPENLSNVGVAPELNPPAVPGSSAPPSWSRVERDTHMSDTVGASEELRLDRRESYLPRPSHPRFMNTSGFEHHDATSPGAFRKYGNFLELQQVNDQNLAEDNNDLRALYPRQESIQGPRETADLGVPSGENIGYVRPDDLSNRSPGALDPTSPAGGPETEVIVLDDDDDDDDEDGAPEGINGHDDDYQVKGHSSPDTPSTPLEGRDVLDPALVEHGAEQHKRRAETDSLKETSSGSDDLVTPGTHLPLDEAFASSFKDPVEINHEGAEAAFQKLMMKLEKPQLEKLLRTHGYVRPKGTQAKQKSSSNEHPVPCSEAGCTKRFKRLCEMKKHLKRHEKPYGCTQCQKRFGSKNDWKRHENSQHFQHEIWKCDEKIRAPISDTFSDTCNKVCHRRETFKQHLISHHGMMAPRIEDKLDKCRIGRLGEARFWCGFCKDVIELEAKKNAHDACNARYDHIDDHYSGRNGAVKKEASEWQYGDSDTAEADVKVSPRDDDPTGERAALPRGTQLRKRSRHGTGPTPKRARISPPREDIMWYCCLCNNAWSFANSPSCIICPTHERCDDCRVEKVEPTEAGPAGNGE